MLLEDFTNEGNSLDLTAAAQMLAICAMVYEDEPENITAFIGPESKLLGYYNSPGLWVPSTALIQSGPKRYFAVAEGTVGWLQGMSQASPLNSLQVLEDLKPETGPLAGIYYIDAARDLVARAQAFIAFDDPEIQLFLAGHSMGGAVAQCAAWYVKHTFGTPDVELLTIGQPKGMGRIPPDQLPLSYFRLTNAEDAVPDYPVAGVQAIVNYGTLRQFSQLAPQAWQHYGREFKMWPNGYFEDGHQPLTPAQRALRVDFPRSHSLNAYMDYLLNCAEVQEPD